MTTQIEPPRIYPAYRYRDPARAIEWFVGTLGFTVRARYNDGPRIVHAELFFGSSIIMIGEAGPDEFGQIVGEPAEHGGAPPMWRWTTSTRSSKGSRGPASGSTRSPPSGPTAAASSPAAIPKATSGASEPTGRSRRTRLERPPFGGIVKKFTFRRRTGGISGSC